MEQHAHPFWSSRTPLTELVTSLESMLTLAISLTITPILVFSVFSSRCCNVVVFPVPRNPESSVIGTGEEVE